MVLNPIPKEVRGQIYVFSLVLNAVGLVASTVLVVVGYPQFLVVVTAATSSVAILAAKLANDNLADPVAEEPDGERFIEEVSEA